MSKYKNMKIKSKILWGFSIMLAILLIAAVGGLSTHYASSKKVEVLNAQSKSVILGDLLARNAASQQTFYCGATTFYLLGDAETTGFCLNKLERLNEEFLQTFPSLQASLNTPQTIEIGSNIKTSYDDYSQQRDELIDFIKNGNYSKTQLHEYIKSVSSSADKVIGYCDNLSETLTGMSNNVVEEIRTMTTSSILLVIAIMLAASFIAVALALKISNSISRPLNLMMSFLKQVGETGNLNFTDEEWNRARETMLYKDETSQSLAAFVKILNQFEYYGQCLNKVASKDISFEVEPLGEQDTIGMSLITMLDNLNNIFYKINNVSDQVASSSNDIAHGAQFLAQGSTEQAATTQEISASINDIKNLGAYTAETSAEASKFSQSILGTAQEGASKMNNLMEAVNQINDSGENIQKVIKAIDDIAFQTNILALNAAVEAARAGVHGKGFAVVANEVRNLAAKSADAAKETADLISENINKTKLGISIAVDTSKSFDSIVGGINKTSELIDSISHQTESNESYTQQISDAIEQSALAIQQNSATSEQSAAASQQMSSQAQVLRSLINQFKLRLSENLLDIQEEAEHSILDHSFMPPAMKY